MAPINPKLQEAVELLIAERFFFLKRFDESKEKFKDLLIRKISKRKILGIEYRLAQICEISGDSDLAKEKYLEVTKNGNKLWIAEESKKHI